VQALLKSNRIERRVKYSESDALLQGKIFDDRGNRMGPSFSSKNGVRYRFYVSTALRGRKHKAGSVQRISAPEIEGIVEQALQTQMPDLDPSKGRAVDVIERVTIKKDHIAIAFAPGSAPKKSIEIPWSKMLPSRTRVEPAPPNGKPDQKLLQSLVRAHAWLKDLSIGRYASVEELSNAASLHPKVVRQGLRLAFLSPAVTSAILESHHDLTLVNIPKLLPLPWHEQRLMLD
jgi:site-specific DNA recombinase